MFEDHLRSLGSRPVDPSILCLEAVVEEWVKNDLPRGAEVVYVPFNKEIAVHIRDKYDFECKRCRGTGAVNANGNYSHKNTARNQYVCQQCNGEGVRHHKDYCIHIAVPDHLWATYHEESPEKGLEEPRYPEASILDMEFDFGGVQ